MYEAGWDRYEGSQYEKDLRDGLKAGNYDLVLSMIDEVIDGFKNDSDKKSNSGEWLAIAYFYMPAAKDRSMNRFMDGIQKMEKPSFLGGKYFILRAYAYLDDRVGFADYYRENCQEIWKGLRDGGGIGTFIRKMNSIRWRRMFSLWKKRIFHGISAVSWQI